MTMETRFMLSCMEGISSTIIDQLTDEVPNLRYFLDGVTPFGRVEEFVDKDAETVDVVGIVNKADEPRSVPTKSGKATIHSFTIVDIERKPFTLTLWEQIAEKYGPDLVVAASAYSVVVAKRLRAKTYDGSIQCVKLNFQICWNIIPLPIPKTLWICGDFWTRSFLQLSEGDQRLYYIGCCNCYTKVNAKSGFRYQCLLCNKEVVATLRPCVTMDVSDHSGTIKAGAIAAVAEEILDCGATKLERYITTGVQFELDPVRAVFNDKMYLICLRRTYSKRTDGQKRLLLVAYFDDTVTPETKSPVTDSNVAESTSAAAETKEKYINDMTSPMLATAVSPNTGVAHNLTISPLKRQLEGVSIKTGSPVKKALFQDSGDGSSDAPPSNDKAADICPPA